MTFYYLWVTDNSGLPIRQIAMEAINNYPWLNKNRSGVEIHHSDSVIGAVRFLHMPETAMR